MMRTAKTHRGDTVELDTLTQDEDGWFGYVLHADGHAVKVFIPGR